MNDNMSGPSPVSSAPQKKNNTWLIVAGVILFLCCCCSIFAVVAWQYGDQILRALKLG